VKLVRRKNYFLVEVNADDFSRFNADQNTRLPFTAASFAFNKETGRCIRVLPHRLRKDDPAWERLREYARNYARGKEHHGYRT